MANGFLRALLMNQQQVFAGAAPSKKVTPPGYLKMLLANSTPNIVSSSIADGSGHIRDVVIKYQPRVPTGKSGTTDDCSIQAKPAYLESTIPALSFRKFGLFLDYGTIAKYEKEASTSVLVGRPAPAGGIINEIYESLIRTGSGLFGDINADLLTAQAASFGKNVSTGLATAKTINFPLSTASNPLNQGMTLLETDIMENEISVENTVIVGSGFINAVYRQMARNTQNAGDQNYPAGAPAFYWDPATASKFGANQFGVFEKDAVQLVNINKFDGFVGGDKMSTFLFTISLPIVDSVGGTELSRFKFDAQLRHIDCPQSVDIAGVPTTVDRGWVIDLMANYAQFNIPADAYDAADRLTGNNGTLRYSATNA